MAAAIFGKGRGLETRSRRAALRGGASDFGRAVTTAILTAAVVLGPFAVGGHAAPPGVPTCSVPGQISTHPDTWYSVKVPSFPVGAQLIKSFAIQPLAPERLYVTNGSAVLRSLDSGCHWSTSYALPESGTGMTVDNSFITEVVVSSPGVVYLPIQQKDPVLQPHIQISQDSGGTWAAAEGPAFNSILGSIVDMDASLGNGSAATILIDVEMGEQGLVGVDLGQALFTTPNAGAAWVLRDLNQDETSVIAAGSSASTTAGLTMDHVVMNPVRNQEIWLYGEDGVYLSPGPGALTPVPGAGAVKVLDVSLDGLSVMGYRRDGEGTISVDLGQTFQDFDAGVLVDSLDVATSRPPSSALSAFGRVFLQTFFPGQAAPVLIDVSPKDGRPISDVQFGFPDNLGQPSIFGHTSNTIEVTYRLEGDEVDPTTVNTVIEAPIVANPRNDLRPASLTQVLQPGATKTIPYTLDLPAANTPLDVYFLMDISSSMQGTIDGIRGAMQEIVEQLAGQKIDVRFGVGSFRAYDDPPAYERDRDIGPADGSLASALDGLRAQGGGDETQMAALLQSVTGEGDSVIPKGLNMHFRPGSLRVAILATDEPISAGGRHPPYTTVIDALVEHDVKAAAMAIQAPPLIGDNDYSNPGPPADILQKVATGSHAVAPDVGVDCDGDGTPEIQPGGPLVCLVDPSRADDAALMADAVVNVLNAVEDIQQIDVTATPLGGADESVIESIEPGAFPYVDLKEPSHHEFEVTVHCPRLTHKRFHTFQIAASQRGAPLGTATLSVVCKPVPVVEKKETPIIATIIPVAAIVPPPPRPPEPVPEPNPNPQPNPQQNPQAQTGFAAQEQQQPQVATAHQEGPPADVAEESVMDEYFMSARRRPTRIPPIAFVFAAGTITSAFACAIARRRFDLAGARNRRDRRS